MDKEEISSTSDNSEVIFIKPDFIKPIKKKIAQTTTEDIVSKNNDEIECVIDTKKNIKDNGNQENETKHNRKNEKSPSQIVAEKKVPIPYKEPTWSGLPSLKYTLEVIKNGIVIENISINQPFFVIGRLSNCDILLEHPTISRFHCILQCRGKDHGTEEEPPGVYAYDLGSTHGTFQNKYRLKPKTYNQVKVGHILKFGGSTRMFVLHGPESDQEPESEYTVSELIAMNNERKLKSANLESDKESEDGNEKNSMKSSSNESTDEGINWGMREDAQEEDEEDEFVPMESSINQELYLDDPKKTLRGWFERRGHDLPDYQVEDMQPGVYKVKLEIPISDCGSRSLSCSIEHRGKKKDAVIQCALEACRILDQRGILRVANNESLEKKAKSLRENDFYESDEDEFWDRTGDVQKKRAFRKRSAAVNNDESEEVVTYESLIMEYEKVISTIEELNQKLRLVDQLKNVKKDEETEELDEYMDKLSVQLPDKHKRVAWKLEEVQMRKEELRLRKLLNVARPRGTPEIMEWRPPDITKEESTSTNLLEDMKKRKHLKVHDAFAVEEEDFKPKLRKVNLDEEDEDVKPVPYSIAPKGGSRYSRPKASLQKAPQKVSTTTTFKLKGKSVSSVGSSQVDIQKSSNEDSETGKVISGVREEDKRIGDSDKFVENENLEVSKSVDEPKERIQGPSLPSDVIKMVPATKVNKESTSQKPKKKNQKSKFQVDSEANYESWVPPTGQTGDGKTHLNDKFGY